MCTASVSRASILIVDDEKIVRECLRMAFKGVKKLYIAANAHEAISHFQQHPIDLVFLDILLPDMDGVDLLKKLKQINPATRVIMVTGVQEIRTAVAAMKAGAFDFLPKPFDVGRIRTVADRALAPQNVHIAMKYDQALEDMMGQDTSMRSIYKIIEFIAPCDSNVLIQGASGTGKKLIARAVHNRSPHAASPFITINCAAMPATLMEKDLFGPCRGAFSGPAVDNPCKNDHVPAGSLFLNNISYLSFKMQAKLLHLIQHNEFKQPGSHRSVRADVRIIAATSQNLQALVDAHLFNEDLYDRLNELPINLTLLSEKGDDIGLLLEHFLKHSAFRRGEPRKHFSPRARSALMTCDWPGNAREFEHLLERLCSLEERRTIRAADAPKLQLPSQPNPYQGLKLKKATRAFERQHILAALKTFEGNRTQAARHLGVHRNTLRMKAKELGIDYQ